MDLIKLKAITFGAQRCYFCSLRLWSPQLSHAWAAASANTMCAVAGDTVSLTSTVLGMTMLCRPLSWTSGQMRWQGSRMTTLNTSDKITSLCLTT